MSQVGMGSRTESAETVTSRGPGLLFVDISVTNIMPKVHKTDLGVLGQIDAAFG